LRNYTFQYDAFDFSFWNCRVDLTKNYTKGTEWWAFRITAPELHDGFLESASTEDDDESFGLPPRLIVTYPSNTWIYVLVGIGSGIGLLILLVFLRNNRGRFFPTRERVTKYRELKYR